MSEDALQSDAVVEQSMAYHVGAVNGVYRTAHGRGGMFTH